MLGWIIKPSRIGEKTCCRVEKFPSRQGVSGSGQMVAPTTRQTSAPPTKKDQRNETPHLPRNPAEPQHNLRNAEAIGFGGWDQELDNSLLIPNSPSE